MSSTAGSSDAMLVERVKALPRDVLARAQARHRKESLRVRPDGSLATTPHPAPLGSALTHPLVTTDFSESQLELITGVHTSAEACIQELTAIHQAVYRAIGDELLWCASMPCRLPDEAGIPIGRYGSSNVGRAKSVYRTGLAHRYGKRMQTISGIHYNFSLPDRRSNDDYFALIRNFRRNSWLLLYLFGASPAVCASFVAGALARAPAALRGHAVPALRDVAADGAARLSERRAILARGELQQPRVATRRRCRRRSRRPYAAYEAIGVRCGRRLPPARHEPAADRERVLRNDPAEARDPAGRAAAARAARARRRVCRGPPDGPRSVRGGRHQCGHLPDARRLPAALPAARQPARHAGGALRDHPQQAARRCRAAASPGCGSLCGADEVPLVEWGARVLARVRADRRGARCGRRNAARIATPSHAARARLRRSGVDAVRARAAGDGARARQLYVRFVLAQSRRHRDAICKLPLAAEVAERFARLARRVAGEAARDRGRRYAFRSRSTGRNTWTRRGSPSDAKRAARRRQRAMSTIRTECRSPGLLTAGLARMAE